MALNTTTESMPTILLAIRPSQMKPMAQLLWQNQPLLLQRQCPQVKSTLPGLINQPVRQATRLSGKKRQLALIRRSTRWVQMCKATAIQMDLKLTQDTTTESELPTGRLIPITRMNRLLRLSGDGKKVIRVYPMSLRILRIGGRPDTPSSLWFNAGEMDDRRAVPWR